MKENGVLDSTIEQIFSIGSNSIVKMTEKETWYYYDSDPYMEELMYSRCTGLIGDESIKGHNKWTHLDNRMDILDDKMDKTTNDYEWKSILKEKLSLMDKRDKYGDAHNKYKACWLSQILEIQLEAQN